jgi:5-methylthioribose kinase
MRELDLARWCSNSLFTCAYSPHHHDKCVLWHAEFGVVGPIAFDVGNLFIAFFASDGHASKDNHRLVQRQCDIARLRNVVRYLQ